MSILISIAVPVYNVGKYLEKCLDSLCRQTYSEIEILLFDDGSADNSLALCRKAEKKDRRIRVWELQHSGVASVRNFAVAQAKGDYLVFVDADDFVEPNYVEVLYAAVRETGSPIAVCGYKRISVDDTPLFFKSGLQTEILSRAEAVKELVQDKRILSTVCMKIFSREIYEYLKFPNGRNYEDLAVMYQVLEHVDQIAYTENTRYYYVTRKDSICNSGYHSGSIDLYIASENLLQFVRERYPALEKIQYLKCIRIAVSILYRMILSGEKDLKVKNRLLKDIKEGSRIFMQSEYPKRDKWFVWIACHCSPLLYVLRIKGIAERYRR